MKESSKDEIEKLEKEALQKSLLVRKINKLIDLKKSYHYFAPLFNSSFYRDHPGRSGELRWSARQCSMNLRPEKLNEKVFWISYSDECANSYQDEKTKLLLNQFFREADYSLIDKLCQENNYNPECIKKFDKTTLDDLYKYIGFLLEVSEDNNKAKANIFCQISDILIIVDYGTYVLVKNYLSSLPLLDDLRQIAGIIPVNLKNGFKLIIVSKQGLMLAYDIKKASHDNVENRGGYLSDFYSYLHVDYETQLLETNPAIAFKE